MSTMSEDNSLALTTLLPPDLLLLIFIHGFKGADTTFGAFPQRLQHVLSESIENVLVQCIVFPAYETKGELNEAVERFADWLTTLTVEREVANGTGGGAGKAKIVLCGHSMGGLLAADTLLEIAKSRPDPQAPLWPRIIACLAFDTPYLGLHPFVFKNSATKALEYADTAKSVATSVFGSIAKFGAKSAPPSQNASVAAITAAPATGSSSWGKWAPAAYAVSGTLLAGAAASTAYYKRENLGMGYSWATDHMKYVGNLWDEDALRKRLENVITIEKNMGIVFRTFYTSLPPTSPSNSLPRTFIVLPAKSSLFTDHFVPASNGLASDEIEAHTGMFEARTNDGYYKLGLETAQLVREAVLISRGLMEGSESQQQKDTAAEAMKETILVTPAQDEIHAGEENPWKDSPDRSTVGGKKKQRAEEAVLIDL